MQIINKKEIPDILTVKIEKLSNLGLGIAKIDGYVIFIPNTCPNDVVKVKLGKKNKNYAKAEVIEIIEPSPERVEPFCKMQKVCGACQLQFINYEAQLKYKKEIVTDTMHSIYGSEIEIRDVIPSPIRKEYRHKIQYPIGQTKESKRILAGYYKTGSAGVLSSDITCTKCSKGTTEAGSKSTKCVCPIGYYGAGCESTCDSACYECTSAGSSGCKTCAANYSATGLGLTKTCKKCSPKGSTSTGNTDSKCICQVGYSNAGNASCASCAEGYYASSQGGRAVF